MTDAEKLAAIRQLCDKVNEYTFDGFEFWWDVERILNET